MTTLHKLTFNIDNPESSTLPFETSYSFYHNFLKETSYPKI